MPSRAGTNGLGCPVDIGVNRVKPGRSQQEIAAFWYWNDIKVSLELSETRNDDDGSGGGSPLNFFTVSTSVSAADRV